MVIFTGVAFMMELAGLTNAGFAKLFTLLGIETGSVIPQINSTINGSLWNTILGASGTLTLIGLAGGLILIGSFIFNRDKAYAILGYLTTTVAYWLSIIIGIINTGVTYGGIWAWISLALMLPLTVGFIQSIVDYFMGYL